jgi:hypothetical protein
LEKGLEEVLHDLQRVISPTPPTYIVINDSKEKEAKPRTFQPIEFEQ